ncbi:MAG: thioredoxin-like domain-containing protein [Bacteroidales bacterium]|nr:thioredoxin-like domain-containing protein [Bacteroidales bacterium]
MKNLILFLSLVLSSIIGVSQNSGYSIKVKVKGLTIGNECYLGNYFGDKQYVRDTAIVDSRGMLEFKGDEKFEGGIYFVVLPDRKYFEILMGENQVFSLETDTIDLINNMRVRGSEDNLMFYEYLKFIDGMHKQISPLSERLAEMEEDSPEKEALKEEIKNINLKVEEYKINFIERHPEKFLSKVFLASKEITIPDAPLLEDGSVDSLFAYKYYKSNYFRYIDFTDDRLLRTPVFYNKLNNYITNLVLQIPDSVIKEADALIAMANDNREMFKYLVWFFTNFSERSNIMGMDAAFVHMAETYYMTNRAFWVSPEQLQKITERAAKLKPLLLGKVPPNVTVMDSIGRRFSLLDVRADYTILYIWSTDCGHCKRMTPILKEFYLENRDKGIEVFALCTETDIDEWKAKVIEYNAPWINVWDPFNMSEFRDKYDVYSTPVIYLLDKDKKIIAKRIDASQLKDFFDKLLKDHE